MPASDSACVMVADQDARRCDALCADLQARGYRCVCVASGPVLLERVSGADAVLLASDLPGLDDQGPVGLDCLTRLRQQYRLEQLPVIVMLPRRRADDVDAVLRAGASDVVLQPVDRALVLGRLRTWLRMKANHDTREHFMRIASHDLRSPLTRILTTADLVCELVPPGTMMTTELHRLLAGVSDAAMRMGRIIEDFIELQAVQDGALSLHLASVDVCELLHSTLDRNLAWATQKGIALSLDADQMCMVQADRARL
ncbi:MAG: hypothetical protein GXP62_18580, partial [Oligoflexia bacterium]|nr:hypothetical protein [Oligoflexia bacterium]